MFLEKVVEIINAFYTIKVHCWERFFCDKATENRVHEIKFLRTTMFLKLLNTAIGFIVTKMSVFTTLLVAFIVEEPGTIHSKRVFVTLVLYEHVRVNFMLLFPQAINDMAELKCSCDRISEFLSLEELTLPTNPDVSVTKLEHGPAQGRIPCVEVCNLTCKWGKDETFRLKDISFVAKQGEFLVIAG